MSYSNELWKEIEGFEAFKVSNFGRVYNTLTNRFVPQHFQKGEFRVSLKNYGKRLTVGVHRLVAQAFLVGFAPRIPVIHLDGDKTNNHVDNLEVRNKETLEREELIRSRRLAIEESLSKGTKVRVVEWDQTFPNVRVAARMVGSKDVSSIYKCLQGKQGTHLGLRFEYVD